MITKIKGTQDILPEEARFWQEIESKIRLVSKIYNFQELRTPIFEATELFHRGVGDTSDIVKKETYDFQDRGDRMITLRPEGTAPIIRSVIENKLYATPKLPLKVYYQGPMFRYERPQKGRQRQFHQFGAEAIGSDSPLVDAEMIAYAATFIASLGIANVKVKLNSLGDLSTKEAYKDKLRDYLEDHVSSLCPDCNRRYKENPLRVLDCKVDKDNPVLIDAPKPLDHLSEAAKAHFDQVCKYLEAMQIDYSIDPTLVRGLDYYTHTVFELDSDIETLGAQSTLGGGGRYNGLSSQLEGPELPAVGFAFGMERLLLALQGSGYKLEEEHIHAFMIALGDECKAESLAIVDLLRHGGLIIDYDYDVRSLKAQFKHAERFNPWFYLIFGEAEMKANTINVKDAATGEQETVEIDKLYNVLVKKIQARYHSCSGNCENCEEDC
ncbi:MAG: histidine--tRNA ligase [Bacilli bacterium]|nr:histidine--tRNA ligase [Bacilli bacterium]MBN2696176.1 histidine--tRNA ligase [Bacilli bacterium]